MLFLGDDHGGEAVVGRRDANWARGNPTVTNILLLYAVWAVEVVFGDQNTPGTGTRPESRSAGGR